MVIFTMVELLHADQVGHLVVVEQLNTDQLSRRHPRRSARRSSRRHRDDTVVHRNGDVVLDDRGLVACRPMLQHILHILQDLLRVRLNLADLVVRQHVRVLMLKLDLCAAHVSA